jgi:ubiquinone biosynthesis UbiH/UbiF/VisC/COQ6 family hydroxylase
LLASLLLDSAAADAKVWEDIAAVRAPAFNKMQVWESVGSGYVRFGGDGASALGYVAENRVLASALYDRLRALSTGITGLTLYENTSVQSLSVPAAGSVPGVDRGQSELAKIELKDGRALRARLVVAADGARSQTRTMAGVGTWSKDYEQSGVVASVRVSRPHCATAWQRFLPTGPLALLPLWSDVCSIVWSVPPAEALRLCSLEPEALAVEINEAFSRAPAGEDTAHGAGSTAVDVLSRSAVKLSKVMAGAAASLTQSDAFELPPVVTSVVGKAASFPLKMAGANEYSRPRLALIG